MKVSGYSKRAAVYFRVIALIAKNSICAQLAYPLNFFTASIIQLSFFVVQLIFISSIYGQVDSIGGWNRYEMIFYNITLMLIDSLFISSAFLNLMELPQLIRGGNLDLLVTKPVNCRFMVSLTRVDVGGLFHVLQCLLLLAYPLYKLGKIPKMADIIYYFAAVVASVFLLYCVYFTMNCIAFWIVKTDFIDSIYGMCYIFALKPVNIYPLLVRAIMYTLLPFGLIMYAPAIMIKHIDLLHLMLVLAVSVIYFVAGNLIWKAGLKRYCSASS